MSLSVSKRMAAVKPSPTVAVTALVAELKAAGRDIISLGAGEPDFDTPLHIKDAARAAMDRGETKYTPVDGTAQLKAAIRDKFLRENDLDYTTSQIIVSSGAKQCLFNLCMGLLNPGDEVVIPAPYWVSYPDLARIAGASPRIIDTGIEDDFKITPQQLDAALNDKTRLMVLNSPSNPTGASYSKSELQVLGAVLQKYPNVVVVADDIYEHIHWGREPFVSFAAACPELYERTVTTNGVSKAYAMTGWRIGYAAGPAELIAAMKTIQSQSTTNPCSLSQAAAVAALSGDQSCVKEMTAAYKQRHDYIVAALNEFDGIECRPGEGTFYAFPKVTGVLSSLGLKSDVDLVERLINDANLACVPGSAFGAPGYLRMSFACSMEMLETSMARLKSVLAA